MKKIRKAGSHYELQELASNIQNEVDRRKLSFDEALSLGNSIQSYADRLPGNTIVYAISNRDSYRGTLELYLKDGYLSKTEQLLLWEERRRLGITDVEHNKMLIQLVEILEKRGMKIVVSRFEEPVGVQ
ncbi:MAG: hypothetical protein CL983_04365 [Euryarchaeota archaeon]|nr:hypothetical protein [Euryarchaeota archaeon]|tara:strand:- start:1734 stop:2120 length:387 start_codon:yes stop_codon:yes gene_type:complete